MIDLVIDYMMLVVLSVSAVAMVVWYFRKRKELIKFLRDIVEELEDVFKPDDKVYELLGYLVGFKAKYKLSRSSSALNAYATLTTTPEYSLLYYPIAKLMSRKNTLAIAVEFRDGLSRDLHIIRSDIKRLERRLRIDVENLDKMRVKNIKFSDKSYIAYYLSEGDVDLILNELSNSELSIFQLSLFSSKNLVLVLVEAKRGVVKPTYKLINTIYSKISKSRGR
ncbi:MAG: hypothetical protein NZ911_05835 [Sulfolobales archaeon]|nr:hypothetical protein [Sulfolobales archaeon]